ncbi:E3 ubiquitin-protein ligase LRSAM1-like isoform X4 [Rhynchophorus ferrugineus]|uniref:E3 ubiquitin-protein ligase LRSAM1-like isoform X4 n=1 Tax=Rhynchophorus ferrugineus TaxID=354439 RepID=UPI003FCE3824
MVITLIYYLKYVPFLICDINFIMFRRKKSVNKKKLEHKLYLARESPELIFDLSDCDLINIPSGVYSLCRVFRKESLRLQNNQLSSLAGGGDLKDLSNLLILDLHNNFFSSISNDIGLLITLQLKKMQEFLEIEKNNELQQKQEIELSNLHKVSRDQLLASLTAEQVKFDDKLNKIHKKKELERFHLIEQLKEAEDVADEAISKLLAYNKEPLAQLLEKEMDEEQKLLVAVNKYNETLHKDDILSAMQNILTQESERFKKLDKYRVETSQYILEKELQTESKLSEILQNHCLDKTNLVNKLMEDSDLQKAAVSTLLERGDARSWGLLQEIRLVEGHLLALTNIEIEKSKLKMNEQLNDLSEKRANLSILLVDLMDRQKARRTQILNTLQEMEHQNTTNENDFWLRQYQQLLNRLPEGLSEAQKNIDHKLLEILLSKGVLHCLPFLASIIQSQWNFKNITNEDLALAGLTNSTDRLKILEALNIYIKEYLSDFSPSAPPEDEEAASAPLLKDLVPVDAVECVICMDNQCHIIFLPCGHLCCCSNCAISVVGCPLCRTVIDRKITMMELQI